MGKRILESPGGIFAKARGVNALFPISYVTFLFFIRLKKNINKIIYVFDKMIDKVGKKKFNYSYNKKNQVVLKRYCGIINVQDITNSWDFAINTQLFPKTIKRFILDYRSAQLDFNRESHLQIASYYQERLFFFRKSRIAILVTDPTLTAITVLFGTLDNDYQSKPFSTEKAALKWVMLK